MAARRCLPVLASKRARRVLLYGLPFSNCGWYGGERSQNTRTFSCARSGTRLASRKPVARDFSQIHSYRSHGRLLMPRALSKGHRAVKTIAPFGRMMRLYSAHIRSKSMLESQELEVAP